MSVGQAPLTRLGLAFLAVGMALLLAVGTLLWSALQGLEEQRRLRHQMVADRVFDEVERELSSLLQHEAKRPARAYDAEDTDVSRWSPFVVGYYRLEPTLHVVAGEQLAAGRRARIRGAAEGDARHTLDASPASPTAAASSIPSIPAGPASPAAPSAPPGQASQDSAKLADADGPLARPERPSSPDVLRQLNRGVKVRERLSRHRGHNFRVAQADLSTLVFERHSPSLQRREGFVVDVPALVAALQGWVLSQQGLDDVAALTRSGERSAANAAYHFGHELAEPFQTLDLSLRLKHLGDADARNSLWGLAAMLAAAAILGLLALYRMVAVQVRFAERRNNFVSAVSHELKTPLTAIRMYGEMLRDGMVTDAATQQEYYATITAEGERLTRLINNVLEHAQLRGGKRAMHLVRADPGAIVREVLEVMGPHIEREGFVLEVDIADSLPHVPLDADALKQVLFNLLDNAIKYGRAETESTLRVSCLSAADRGGIELSVRDHGPGVTPDQLDSVFEPFFRAEDELTRRQKGTGIGLALVRDLVERMHGQVSGHLRTPGFEVRVAFGVNG